MSTSMVITGILSFFIAVLVCYVTHTFTFTVSTNILTTKFAIQKEIANLYFLNHHPLVTNIETLSTEDHKRTFLITEETEIIKNYWKNKMVSYGELQIISPDTFELSVKLRILSAWVIRFKSLITITEDPVTKTCQLSEDIEISGPVLGGFLVKYFARDAHEVIMVKTKERLEKLNFKS